MTRQENRRFQERKNQVQIGKMYAELTEEEKKECHEINELRSRLGSLQVEAFLGGRHPVEITSDGFIIPDVIKDKLTKCSPRVFMIMFKQLVNLSCDWRILLEQAEEQRGTWVTRNRYHGYVLRCNENSCHAWRNNEFITTKKSIAQAWVERNPENHSYKPRYDLRRTMRDIGIIFQPPTIQNTQELDETCPLQSPKKGSRK